MMSKKSPTALDKEIGQRIRFYRTKAYMSQAELGKRLGITFQQIQKYENGTNRISVSRLSQISLALDVGSYLFLNETSPHQREMEQLISSQDELDVLRAFSQIQDCRTRQAILGLLQTLALDQNQKLSYEATNSATTQVSFRK